MITVISGTNRPNSNSAIIAEYVLSCFETTIPGAFQFLDLATLSGPFMVEPAYRQDDQSPMIQEVQRKYMDAADAFYFVIPEYNGSFPGILKYFIDACSAGDFKRTFNGKRAAILGLSTGRAGNLRGMDHLTGVLNYLNVVVMPDRLPVSRVQDLIHENALQDDSAKQIIRSHVTKFIDFCH
jgi:NAD(P)H-dependent FMN reductase